MQEWLVKNGRAQQVMDLIRYLLMRLFLILCDLLLVLSFCYSIDENLSAPHSAR